jgi:hypothetical protein
MVWTKSSTPLCREIKDAVRSLENIQVKDQTLMKLVGCVKAGSKNFNAGGLGIAQAAQGLFLSSSQDIPGGRLQSPTCESRVHHCRIAVPL